MMKIVGNNTDGALDYLGLLIKILLNKLPSRATAFYIS
jgi:hypothetical protein